MHMKPPCVNINIVKRLTNGRLRTAKFFRYLEISAIEDKSIQTVFRWELKKGLLNRSVWYSGVFIMEILLHVLNKIQSKENAKTDKIN